MTAKKTVKKKPTKLTKEMQELQRFADALKATQHNPVNWAAIIGFVGPIVARIATRYAVRYVAKKWGRKASVKIVTEAVESVADDVGAIIQKNLKRS